MARAIWRGVSGIGDLDVITAGPEDILEGKVGVDIEGEPVIGKIPNRGILRNGMSINGSLYFPAAYYEGLEVVQNIPVMGGFTATPSTTRQVLKVADVYMSGDIIIPEFTMPPANVIKKGYVLKIYDQQVTGTY